MILVLNLNPSLDKIYTVDELLYGQAVRARTVQNTAGGKGTHVAHVLQILGEEVVNTGFLGGYIGKFIQDSLTKWGIEDQSVAIAADTRSCLNVATPDGKQTEVLEPGPMLTEEEKEAFLQKYEELLAKCSLVVASGSLPKNLDNGFYPGLIAKAKAQNKPFLLDTSGDKLVYGLKAQPYFIKPNQDEVAAISGKVITSLEEAVEAIRRFMADGVECPALSLGKKGSLVGYQGKIYHAQPPMVDKVINAVGSGDSYVAGFAAGLARKLPIEEIIQLASACGTANVLEAESGFVNIDKVNEIKAQVKITVY